MSKTICRRKGGKSRTGLWNQHGCYKKSMRTRTRTRTRRRTRTRTRRSRSMKMSMKGGCGSCGTIMRGGRGLPPIPKPLVGAPWTSQISSWPGVSGQQGVTNYFKNNTYTPVDISRTMQSTAQTNDATNRALRPLSNSIARKVQKGGSFSQDLSNLGQSLKYGVGNGINAFLGKPQSVNNLPYKGQFPNNLTNQQLRNVM